MFSDEFREVTFELLLCWYRHRSVYGAPLADGETRGDRTSSFPLAPVPRDGLYLIIHSLAAAICGPPMPSCEVVEQPEAIGTVRVDFLVLGCHARIGTSCPSAT